MRFTEVSALQPGGRDVFDCPTWTRQTTHAGSETSAVSLFVLYSLNSVSFWWLFKDFRAHVVQSRGSTWGVEGHIHSVLVFSPPPYVLRFLLDFWNVLMMLWTGGGEIHKFIRFLRWEKTLLNRWTLSPRGCSQSGEVHAIIARDQRAILCVFGERKYSKT